MKDLEQLKRETEDDMRAARERRLDRQARERRDGPILAAFDRMANVEQEQAPDLPEPYDLGGEG